jgi:phosphatidylinositol alpha-1,6-mannosyltransferase
MKCLMFATIFPPINGGSAVVYESLCQFSPKGSIHVLAPWRHYLTGQEIDGWREYDAAAEFPITRIELLRPPAVESRSLLHSAWLQLVVDLPIKISVLRTAIRLVREQKIDVICICELNSGTWLGLVLRRLFGIPFINYIHGEEITTDSSYRIYGRRRREFLQRADAVVAVSEFTRNCLIDLFGVAAEKIELITNGVDAQRFHPGARDSALVARYDLVDKKILLTVGRLVERKGIDMTLRAMPTILAQVPNAHYLIVGTGEFEPQLRALVRELGLTSHVTFAGRVPTEELVAHYQLCDLFVMPNRELDDHDTEGFGLVFLEANACAKAVVGGRAGGAVEAVRHGVTGLTVDGTDPLDIAAAVVELLTNDAKRQTMERQGLEVARQSSSAERAPVFQALCERVARTRRRRSW